MEPGGSVSSTPMPASSTSPTVTFALEDCPVRDPQFCAVAVNVANAIVSRDTETLVLHSRPERFVCEDIQSELFPACTTHDVLQGYSIVGADLMAEVVPEDAYRDRLEAIFANVDPSFSDNYGGGSAEVLGIGRCGGDTYDIAWTAGVSGGDATAERVLASFELSRVSGPWLIELWLVDRLETWRSYDPFLSMEDIIASVGCDAASRPWPA